jgi:hypothetical protein
MTSLGRWWHLRLEEQILAIADQLESAAGLMGPAEGHTVDSRLTERWN